MYFIKNFQRQNRHDVNDIKTKINIQNIKLGPTAGQSIIAHRWLLTLLTLFFLSYSNQFIETSFIYKSRTEGLGLANGNLEEDTR